MPLSPLQEQPTAILGRTQELEFIRRRLPPDHVRLLTLTGPAGVGKTRLALEAGSQLASAFPQGVILVDLTPVRDPERVLATIAHALGVAEQNGRTLLERVEEFLRERTLLLILDNFDRVSLAASELSALLAGCPGVRMLVTSRTPLHLRWEQTLRLAPLAVPDLSRLGSIEALGEVPAVALYLERVHAVSPDFSLRADNARAVAELVVRLDGLPLAIELAAVRSPVLSPQMLVERLNQRLSLLRWDAQDLPDRQHSLGTAIGWSYDLLSVKEQSLFRHLGVFLGGFDLEAAEAMVAGTADGTVDVLEALGSLVDQSMIQVENPAAPQTRYTMLESMREYAFEQLATHGELAATERSHADYFLALAEMASPHLRTRNQQTWYLRLDREHENFAAALHSLLNHGNGDLSVQEMALRLAAALGYFWVLRGHHAEGRRWMARVLNRTPDADPAVRSSALESAGLLLTFGGDYDLSREALDKALALSQQSQNESGRARTLTRLGATAVLAGEWDAGVRGLEEALRHWEEIGDHFESGATLFYLGSGAFMQRDYERAASLYSDSLARFDAIGNKRASGALGLYLGLVLGQLDDTARAVHLVQEGVLMSRSHLDSWYLSLGVSAALQIVGEQVPLEERARLLGAEDALCKKAGADQNPWERVTGQITARLREHPQQEGWDEAFQEGQSLTFDDVVARTLAILKDFSNSLATGRDVKDQPSTESIVSERELEVLQLVARGLSSKVIGKRLFISVSTVNYHLTSIFNKLGVDTRAQAVAEAARRGVLSMAEPDA